MANLVIKLIVFYQKFLSFDSGILSFLAPGGACIYPVSCSEYMKESIRDFGVARGIGLGFKRFLSCNNWGFRWN